jgi:rod shape-determining protein MreC
MGDLGHRLTARQRLAATTLAVIAVCFIALDLTGGSLSEAHAGSRGLLGALYRGTDSVLGPARRYLQALPDAAHNSARVSTLEDENAKLQAQLAANAEDNSTAAQLARLNLTATAAGVTIAPARVIAFGPGQGFDWTATIDIGTSSGVAVDETVTSAAGLVGRVLRADPSTAVVLLAADPGSGVGVRDVRSGELALATGAGSDGYTLTPLDPSADFKPGDQLETGPAGSSTFIAGLLVGTVTALHLNASGAAIATARSSISPTAINLVGVVVPGASR